MKRLVLAFFLLSVFSVLSVGQSGRRIATPKPTPAVTVKDDSDEPDFSESIPVKTRTPVTRPTLRPSISAPSDTTQAANTPPTATVEGDVVKVETDLVTIPVSVY